MYINTFSLYMYIIYSNYISQGFMITDLLTCQYLQSDSCSQNQGLAQPNEGQIVKTSK